MPPVEQKLVRVHISYTHESYEHTVHVLDFANILRTHGIDVGLDQYTPVPSEGWNVWMEKQVSEADYILIVCTETYYRRAMGQEKPGVGMGLKFEWNLIKNRLDKDVPQGDRCLPILFEDRDIQYVPDRIRWHARFIIKQYDLADAQFEALYRHLTGQPSTLRPGLGDLKMLPARNQPTIYPVMPSSENISQGMAREAPDGSLGRLKSHGSRTNMIGGAGTLATYKGNDTPPYSSSSRQEAVMAQEPIHTQQTEPPITKNFLVHLARGGVKSIPMVGDFIDEMIFGTLEGEEAAKQSAKVNDALSSIQTAQGDEAGTLSAILDKLTSQVDLNAAVRARLEDLASAVRNPDTAPSISLQTSVNQFLEKHEVRLDDVADRMESVVARLEERTANIIATPTVVGAALAKPINRVQLIKKLSRLTSDNMDILVLSVMNAANQVPRNIGVAGQAAALVRFVESTNGPGLDSLYATCEELFESF